MNIIKFSIGIIHLKMKLSLNSCCILFMQVTQKYIFAKLCFIKVQYLVLLL